MKEGYQQLLQHSVPKEQKINDFRLNLTFRKMK
jgi:hypothetical protein